MYNIYHTHTQTFTGMFQHEDRAFAISLPQLEFLGSL